MTLEEYGAVGSLLLATVGGPPAVRAIGRWLAKRVERREALKVRELEAKREDAKRDDEREDRTEQHLWKVVEQQGDRVGELEKQRHEIAATLSATQALNAQTVQVLGQVELELAECKRDREDCKRDRDVDRQRISALEANVPADLTGKIKTEVKREITRRASVQDMKPIREGDPEPK